MVGKNHPVILQDENPGRRVLNDGAVVRFRSTKRRIEVRQTLGPLQNLPVQIDAHGLQRMIRGNLLLDGSGHGPDEEQVQGGQRQGHDDQDIHRFMGPAHVGNPTFPEQDRKDFPQQNREARHQEGPGGRNVPAQREGPE